VPRCSTAHCQKPVLKRTLAHDTADLPVPCFHWAQTHLIAAPLLAANEYHSDEFRYASRQFKSNHQIPHGGRVSAALDEVASIARLLFLSLHTGDRSKRCQLTMCTPENHSFGTDPPQRSGRAVLPASAREPKRYTAQSCYLGWLGSVPSSPFQ